MLLTVAIIGRPNVGKSTLFNRLVGRREALVDDQPGVTRDRREGIARIGDLQFRAIDTAGLEDFPKEFLEGKMRQQTEIAVNYADVVLMLIDARVGLTPVDMHFCDWLRKVKRNVVLVANKCEGGAGSAGFFEAYGLGMGEPVSISAEHGEGLADLYEALSKFVNLSSNFEMDYLIPDQKTNVLELESEDGAMTWRDPSTPKVLRLAIVGRPNVGKSTLMNTLLGENRVLTGPEAGITRDAIEVEWSWRGEAIKLVDTAGLRRRTRVEGRIEWAAGEGTRRAVRFAHVVILVLDAQAMLERQDLNIARLVIDEGRAIVLAANKWDTILDHDRSIRLLRERINISLPQVRNIPYVTISALEGRNVDRVLDSVISVYDTWNRRVSTSRLNRWLATMVNQHPPPLSKGRRIRLRYITQAKTRPPAFACFCSQPDDLPDSYVRYLVNGLREEFSLPAIPIRFMLRKGKNPYNQKINTKVKW